MNIFQKISYLGVNDKMPVYEQKSTVLFNQIIRILLFIIIIGICLFYFVLDYKIVPLCFLCSLPVIGFSLFLNLKSKVKISVIIISVFFPLFFLFISIFAKLKGEANNYIFFIAPRFGIIIISIICYLIIGLEHPRKSVFTILTGAIIYIFYDKIHLYFGLDIRDYQITDWEYNLMICEIGGLGIIFIFLSTFLQKINSRYDSIVKEQNKNLIEKNEEILQQNEEIRSQRDEIEAQKNNVTEQKEKIEYQNKEITDSIVYAKRIQKAILGNIDEITEKLKESFIFFKPHSIVSGDFFWFAEKKSENESLKLIVAADCTGHGVPGAFMTVMGHDLLDDIVEKQNIIQPAEILKILDINILQRLKKSSENKVNDGMDIAILLFDYNRKKVVYAGAKNPLYFVRNKEMNVIKASKFTIGGNEFGEKLFEQNELELFNNDIFYIFSDGFQDQFGGEMNQKYMTKNFRNFLLSISDKDMNEQRILIEKEFLEWKKDNKQTDDVLVIGIKYSESIK